MKMKKSNLFYHERRFSVTKAGQIFFQSPHPPHLQLFRKNFSVFSRVILSHPVPSTKSPVALASQQNQTSIQGLLFRKPKRPKRSLFPCNLSLIFYIPDRYSIGFISPDKKAYGYLKRIKYTYRFNHREASCKEYTIETKIFSNYDNDTITNELFNERNT